MLSVLVEAVLPLVAASLAPLALTVAMTVPSEVMPETATLYVVPEPLTRAIVAPAAPDRRHVAAGEAGDRLAEDDR